MNRSRFFINGLLEKHQISQHDDTKIPICENFWDIASSCRPWNAISHEFSPFSRDFSPVSFNGYTVFPQFDEGRRSGQVVRQVFQADFDFRAAAAFWRIPVQTFQLFPKYLPQDQHLQNSQPAPEFFQVIVPFIHEENSTFFVKKFFSHSNSLTWRSFYAKMLFVDDFL